MAQERDTSHLMRPLGPDCGAYTSASLPVFLRPLCHERSGESEGGSVSVVVPSISCPARGAKTFLSLASVV